MSNTSQRSREHLLRALAAVAFLIFFQAFMVAPLLPRLADLFHVSVTRMGLIVPAYMIPYGMVMLVYGPLSDRVGRRRIIGAALLAFIVLTAATASAHSLPTLLLLRLLTGLAASGLVPMALALIGDLFPFAERGRPLGWLFGAIAGGMACGSTAGVMLEPVLTWRGLFLGVAGFGAVMGLALLPSWSLVRGVPQRARLDGRALLAGYVGLLRAGRGRRTYGYVLLNAIFHAGVYTWLGVYFAQRHGLGEIGIGLALLGYGVPGFLLGPRIGRAADRWGRRWLLPAGLALAGASVALLALELPVLEGHPMSDTALQSLSAAAREELQQRQETLQDELKASLKQIRELERTAQDQLQALDRQVVQYSVSGLIEDLTEKYRGVPEVVSYLTAVERDIIEHIEPFKPSPSSPAAPPPQGFPTPPPWAQEVPIRKYTVNVLVDHSKQAGAPVVIEFHPSYNNLFGRIEKETQFGALYTDFSMIKAGAFHRANGGYLVLPAEDVVCDPVGWEGVKRALHSRAIQIEELGERLGFPAIKSLRPQPIPLDVKVLLVGRPQLYALLQTYDEEFPELFKVKADFDTRMACNDENIVDFLRFVCTLCCNEGLSHMDSSAVAKVLEHAMRLAEDQTKLSTQFGTLADLIREAHFWARHEDAPFVSAAHVHKAMEAKVSRVNLVQEHMQEMITRGTLFIDTIGHAVGQVNGLSVISLGDYLFGRPSRITASVAPGREGIIDIEREVSLGGPLHSKGLLIVSGYLAHQYAQDKPLTLAARLVFEQSYEGVEGDSASSAELYALLSALSGVPISQGIAVTGSVNQHGEVQAIGGVNQKIEGFFDVCQARGLTGEQGVLIPSSNVPHLMLREDVVDAVRAQQFHVWAVKTIDEGMEILTGMPAGVRDTAGGFPAGTLNERVDRRLREFAECLKAFQAAGAAEVRG